MARKPVEVKRKRAIVRLTRSEAYLANLKYMGEEPVLSDSFTETEYGQALTWYTYMASTDEARQFLKDYFKERQMFDYLSAVDQIPDSRFPHVAAWIARIISRGAQLREKSKQRILDEVAPFLQKKARPASEQPRATIQDRMNDRAHDLIGDFEYAIDCAGWASGISIYKFLEHHQAAPAIAMKIGAYYVRLRDEAIEMCSKSCSDALLEGYRNLTIKQRIARATFYKNVVEECEKYAANERKQTKQRAPKPVSAEKKLKNFKFKKHCDNYKISSVSPAKILGAQVLWALNTNNNTITVYHAKDRGGLDISRTSIANFDEATTATKRLGRNAEAKVAEIVSGGKRAAKKLFDSLRAAPKVQERINEETILVRVE